MLTRPIQGGNGMTRPVHSGDLDTACEKEDPQPRKNDCADRFQHRFFR